MDSIELAFSCLPQASLDLLRATALSFVPKLVQRVKLSTCTVLLKTKLGEGGAATVYEAEVTAQDVSAEFNEQQAVALREGSLLRCSSATISRTGERSHEDAASSGDNATARLWNRANSATAITPDLVHVDASIHWWLLVGCCACTVPAAQQYPNLIDSLNRDVKPHNVLLERCGGSAATQRASPTSVPHQSLMGRSTASLASSTHLSPAAAGASPEEYLCVLTDLGSCCEAADLKVDSVEDVRRVAASAERACSPLYRPPELYEPPTRGELDSRVDVWALGCLLYFMMMRVNPFEKQCMQGASLVLAVQRAKVDWSEAPAYLHPDLKELVHACLRPKLQERPTCTELRQWIDRMKAWMGK